MPFVRISLLEHNGRLLNHEDEDVSDAVQALLINEGIDVSIKSKVLNDTSKSGSQVALILKKEGRQEQIEGIHILAAAGHKPHTCEFGLELAGIKVTKNGYVQVNEKLETTAAGVWAVGDVAGSTLQ